MRIGDLPPDLAALVRRLVRDGWVVVPTPQLEVPARVSRSVLRFRPDASTGDIEAAVSEAS